MFSDSCDWFWRQRLLDDNCFLLRFPLKAFKLTGGWRGLDLGRAKRIWYLSPMRAAKVQASLRICAVSPGPSLLTHTSSESRGTFRQKARSLAPLNDWACAVKICHDRMLEDINSLDAAHLVCLRTDYRSSQMQCALDVFRYFRKTESPSHNFSVVKKHLKDFKFYLSIKVY